MVLFGAVAASTRYGTAVAAKGMRFTRAERVLVGTAGSARSGGFEGAEIENLGDEGPEVRDIGYDASKGGGRVSRNWRRRGVS